MTTRSVELTGGIGGRGPGETKLEIGRRRARERIQRLEDELKQLMKQRAQRRRKRLLAEIPTVAIVGYTNAGKSTLLNTLTHAGVLAENRLFATLDPRARQLALPTQQCVVLTDTVGFIRDMPETLFTAFRATFEEAADADVLIEVVDVSDPEHHEHMGATALLLEQLGLADRPRITVLNKIDKADSAVANFTHQCLATVALSALDPATTRPLLDCLSRLLLPKNSNDQISESLRV